MSQLWFGALCRCLAGLETLVPSGLMMEHQHPPLPPLSLPGCIASQHFAFHHHFVLCPHHHHLHHGCHNHHLHHGCHNHHHHHHVFCRHHNSLSHQTDHFHLTPRVTYSSSLSPPAVSLLGQPQVGYSVCTQNHQNLGVSASKDAENSGVQLHEEGIEELEEEEEPVFVMTNEWMEFFAKSEAKRRLEKKQAKKKKAK